MLRIKSLSFAVLILCSFGVTSLGNAHTIRVPGDNATIQGAITQAVNGDTVLVAPGTYNENIAINKAVSVKSSMGKASTTIHGTSASLDVVTITVNGASLSGFTVDSGRYSLLASAPAVSDFIVADCRFQNSANFHAVLQPSVVSSVVPGIELVSHVSGKYNAIAIVNGALTTSATWPVPPEGFVYYVRDDSYLRIKGSGGPVLRLQPGTKFKFEGNAAILVAEDASSSGGLVADEVVFTSYRDDSVGGDSDGSATAPAAGNWRNVVFGPTARADSCVITSCEFRYGGAHGARGIVEVYMNATFTGCSFDSASTSELCVPSGRPVVTGCTFGQSVNGSFPVLLSADCVAGIVANNTFEPRSDGKWGRLAILNSPLTQSATWPVPPEGFVYYVCDDSYLRIKGSGGPVLRLQPGTVVKFEGNAAILVAEDASSSGGLVANEVIFTSYRNDVVGGDSDGSATAPTAGNWRNIWFGPTARADSCVITSCEFRYGGAHGAQGIVEVYMNATFTGCSFSRSSTAGMWLNGSNGGRPIIKQCVFEFNKYGLRSINNGRAFGNLTLSCFQGNTSYGISADVFADKMGDFAARNCWWGDPSGPSGAGPGRGDAITDNINFSPWAAEQVCSPPSPPTDVDNHAGTPSRLIVHTPYPNPFNPMTTVEFELPEAAEVTLAVYSIKGELVSSLVEGTLPAGYHKAIWNGRDHGGRKVASGIYFYRFSTGSIEQTGKLILLR